MVGQIPFPPNSRAARMGMPMGPMPQPNIPPMPMGPPPMGPGGPMGPMPMGPMGSMGPMDAPPMGPAMMDPMMMPQMGPPPMDPMMMPPDPMMMVAPPPPPMLPPMPPPPPPAPPGPDPMLMAMIEAILNPPEEEEEVSYEDYEPPRPRWFKKPRKPGKGWIVSTSTKREQQWATWRARVSDDLKWFTFSQVGVFPGFQKKKHTPWHSPALYDGVNLVANQIGGIEETRKVLVADPTFEQEAQDVEDFLDDVRTVEIERHATRLMGDLRRDEALTAALYGAVVCRVVVDYDDEEMPIKRDILDPATCFPETDSHGLSAMWRIYSCTADEMISDYDTEDGDLAAKWLKEEDEDGDIVDNDDGVKRYDRQERVRVVEYWDRYYRAVYANDRTVIEPTAHKMMRVPFVYTRVSLGVPAFTRSPVEGENLTTGYEFGDDQLAHYGHGHITGQKKRHEQREATLSLLATEFKKGFRPAWMLEVDAAGNRNIPDIQNEENGVVRIFANHQKLSPLVTRPPSDISGPLFQAMDTDRGTNDLPPAAFGINDNAVATGNAIEGLNEAGRDKLTPIIRALTRYHEEKDRLTLTLWRDWGRFWSQDDESFGDFPLMRRVRKAQSPMEQPNIRITPEMVENVGVRVRVKMTQIRLQNLAALGNAYSIWKGAGGMSNQTGMTLRGEEDPLGEEQQIMYEEALTDERLRDLAKLEALRSKNSPLAGLFESMIQEKNAAASAPPGGPPPGGPPGGAPPGMGGPIQTTSGMDVTAMPQIAPTGPVGRPGIPGLPF